MLETIRNNTKSLLIYLIFGILIAVFVISFGPQQGQTGGCGGSTSASAKAGGETISETTWRYGIMLLAANGSASGERARKMQVRERVLDALFVRELLAGEAKGMGFKVSDDEIYQRLGGGDIYLLGRREDTKRLFFYKEE